jgi:hypothetical protein
VWELTELADLFKKGLAPVSGGTLDQAAVFLEACRCWWAEVARCEKEEMARKTGPGD